MEAAPLGLLDGIYALIVEDDTDTRQILESYLRHQGAVVTVMANVNDALAIMRNVTPHVILSDISQPEMKASSLPARCGR
jgi:CheY-like chemotaxis protein